MTKIKWVDETTWTAKLGECVLIVTRHMEFPGQWVMMLRGKFEMDLHPLNNILLEEVKKEALKYLEQKLAQILKEMNS